MFLQDVLLPEMALVDVCPHSGLHSEYMNADTASQVLQSKILGNLQAVTEGVAASDLAAAVMADARKKVGFGAVISLLKQHKNEF